MAEPSPADSAPGADVIIPPPDIKRTKQTLHFRGTLEPRPNGRERKQRL